MKMIRCKTITTEEEIPNDLETFKNWEFSSGTTTGEDFKIFAKVFKKYIKNNLPNNATLADFSIGHYFISGFVQKNSKYAYFSISDVRHFPNKWFEDILIRTAKDAKDYTGGSNENTTLENFKQEIDTLVS